MKPTILLLLLLCAGCERKLTPIQTNFIVFYHFNSSAATGPGDGRGHCEMYEPFGIRNAEDVKSIERYITTNWNTQGVIVTSIYPINTNK